MELPETDPPPTEFEVRERKDDPIPVRLAYDRYRCNVNAKSSEMQSDESPRFLPANPC